MRLWMKNMRFVEVPNPSKCFIYKYFGGFRWLWQIMTNYDKFENFMNIYAKIDTKSDPKIEVWAFRGPTFQVFGSILRNAIFWLFLKCVKIDKIRKRAGTLGARRDIPATLGVRLAEPGCYQGGKEGLKPLRAWQGAWARHLKPRIWGLEIWELAKPDRNLVL